MSRYNHGTYALTEQNVRHHDAHSPLRSINSATDSGARGGDSCVSAARSTLSVRSSVSQALSTGSSLLSSELDRYRVKRKYDSTKRRLNMSSQERNTKRKKSLSPENIYESSMKECCALQCMSKINLQTFVQWRQEFVQLSGDELNTKVMGVIASGREQLKVHRKYFYPLPSTGRRACAATICEVYSISIRHFTTLANRVAKGGSQWFRVNRALHTGWKDIFVPWVTEYAERYGNKMPDNRVIEISVGNKWQIYEKFKFYTSNLQGTSLPSSQLSSSWFYTLWNKYLPHIRVPKETRFSKCDVCCLFKERLSQKAPHTLRAKWMAEFDEHLDMQMKERSEYYKRRSHARMYPDEAWCLMVDGMAQNITNVPYYPSNRPKSLFGRKTYDLHVVGVMFHGGPSSVVYVHDTSVSTGPNMTIQCIWNTIISRSRSTKLPPTLYLQLDNTASDNKNHHVLEFCAWLVEEGYFQEV